MCAAGDHEPGRCWCRACQERCSCRESSVNALARTQNIAGGSTRSTVHCSRHEPLCKACARANKSVAKTLHVRSCRLAVAGAQNVKLCCFDWCCLRFGGGVRPTFFHSAAMCPHVGARLTRESTKHEGRKPRASERHVVGCCEELGAG